MGANGAVAVTAIGMTTPVGLTAAQTCAAVRAGISAIAELPFVFESEAFKKVPLMGCAVRGVTDGYLGLGRWARLATAALKDLTTGGAVSLRDLRSAALYLALPPRERGADARVFELLGSRIAEWVGLAGLDRRTHVYAEGHAAAARACEDALADVTRGVVERAIVCGVDSLIEPSALEFFLGKRRLKTVDRVDGFIPGEAAACFVMEPAAQVAARGGSPLASAEAASTATEPVTVWSEDPSPSTGLSEAVRRTLDKLADRGAETRVVVCDLNGETYRAREFAHTAARVLSAIPAPWTVWHPADCLGDTGAAAFAVSACVAIRGLAKGYAKGNAAVVLGSSDDGLRGAASFRRIPAEA